MGDNDRGSLNISDFEAWYDNLVAKLLDELTEDVYLRFDSDKIDFQQVEEEIISHLNGACSGKEKLCCLKLLELLQMKCHYGMTKKMAYVDEEYRKKVMESAMSSYDQKDFETAAYAFRKLAEADDSVAQNNLAYMIRRKQTEGRTEPSILEAMILLRKGIEDKDAFSLVNMALIFALDLGEERDWRTADKLISGISTNGAEEVFHWWKGLANAGELEGTLVLLWLLRHGKVKQSQVGNVKELQKQVKESLGKAPEWLNEIL